MKQDKINRILQLIKNDKVQEQHLFKTLSTMDNPFPLFIPLKNAGYFNPDRNPTPIEDKNQKGYFYITFSNVLTYLENVARKNKLNPLPEITEGLLEIVDSIIDYRDKDSNGLEIYKTDWYLIKIIFLLPVEKINKKHIDFVRTALNSDWSNSLVSDVINKFAIPVLIKSNAKDLLIQLFNIVLDYKELPEKSFEKYTSLLDSYWLSQLLETHKKNLTLYSLEIAGIALSKMKELIEKDASLFNYSRIPTIEDHPQTTSPEKYENQLVYLVRDLYEKTDPKEIHKIIKELLNKEHHIYKRLALHLINHHYNELNSLFWNWDVNPFNIHLIKPELYKLLKNNSNSFNNEQLDKVISWVEDVDVFMPDKFKNDQNMLDKAEAYAKKEWLSALLDTKNEKILSLYKKYDSINPEKLDHPGYCFWHEIIQGDISPINKLELESKSIKEIVQYINLFKETGEWKAPTKSGLARLLSEHVASNPEKYLEELNRFLEVEIVFQHAILSGFLDAWRSDKTFDWKNLINFMYDIIKNDNFWEEKYSEGFNYRNWIISIIADLINEGTKKDSHAFDSKYLLDAEKILLLLVEKTESDYYEIQNIATSVLNSNTGKIFTAMVNYSLRYARVFNKDKTDKWKDSIKKDFTKRLTDEIDMSIEFRFIIGGYLINLYYLDAQWVTENIDKIFLKDKDDSWKTAFSGYLIIPNKVYSVLYKLLSKKGDYDKALNANFNEDYISERLAQHICIAYFEDWEDLENSNSLIYKLINNANPIQVKALINFLWSQRGFVSSKKENKIKPLWTKLFAKLKDNENEETYQQLLVQLSSWLEIVDIIDENIFEWLKASIKYFKNNKEPYSFIENLLKHSEQTPEFVAKLFLELLNNDIYPTYPEDDILKIIDVLNNKGLKQDAIKICNLYLQKGFDFVKPTYEKIRKEKESN